VKIATWNINSVRLRIKLVARLAAAADPDVICLQETKTIDDLFPKKAIAKLGYVHQAFHGIKGYNGVAIVSRRPFENDGRLNWCGKQDARHAHVRERRRRQINVGGTAANRIQPRPQTTAGILHCQ